MTVFLAKDWTEIALLPDGVGVLVNGEPHLAGRMACRVLEVWRDRAPGSRVIFRQMFGPGQTNRYMAALDRFLSRFDDLALKRDMLREHGTAVNFTVRAASAEEIAAAAEAEEKPKPKAKAKAPPPVMTAFPKTAAPRFARRPAPLGPDEVRALAARYARGEITREAMSRAFWRAPG